QLVSGDFFRVLGVAASVGRVIGPEDDRHPNAQPVAVLGDHYWTDRFGRDPAVVGRTVQISGTPFTIVGIAPPRFSGVETGTVPDLYLPMAMQPTVMPAFENLLDRPGVMRTWVEAIARTSPGVTAEQAAAELTAIDR